MLMSPAATPPVRLNTPAELRHLLRSRRKAQKLSQANLSHKLGLSQPRISVLEGNPRDVSFALLLNWLNLLGLSLMAPASGDTAPPSTADTSKVDR